MIPALPDQSPSPTTPFLFLGNVTALASRILYSILLLLFASATTAAAVLAVPLFGLPRVFKASAREHPRMPQMLKPWIDKIPVMLSEHEDKIKEHVAFLLGEPGLDTGARQTAIDAVGADQVLVGR